MSYTALNDMASGIAEVVTETGLFRQVVWTQATNAAQLWSRIESLVALPSAVVAMGESEYGERGLLRTLHPMIFIVAPFARGAVKEAAGIWTLLEAVEAAFQPVEGVFKTIGDIEFHLENSSPIESPEKVSACCLTLSGIEYMKA